MAPERADLVLSAHVPHVELDVLVSHCLDVESDGGYGGDILVEFKLVEDRCGCSQSLLGFSGSGKGKSYWSCQRHRDLA